MKLTKAIDDVRFEINDDDSANGYRYSRLDFEDYFRDSIREIYRKRPDIRLNDDFEMSIFADPYRYDESAYYIEGFYDIVGWDKVTYPVLYFETTGANAITAYAEVGHSTALFSTSWTGLGDLIRITNDLAGGSFGGLITPIQDITHTTAFTITAVELEIDIDFFIERAIVFYLAYSALSRDNEDTHNAQRSIEYFEKFKAELGV